MIEILYIIIFLILAIVYVSLFFSFVSVWKSSFNLQKVNIFEFGLASPKSPKIFFVTSLAWLASMLIFRGASIAVTCVYIGHHFKISSNPTNCSSITTNSSIPGLSLTEEEGKIIMIPAIFGMIFVVVLINIGLKRLFHKSGTLLSGAMSIVSPAKFICGDMSDLKDCREKTWKYLLTYCVFNILFMYFVFLALVLVDDDTYGFYENCHQHEHTVGEKVFLPKLTAFLVVSLFLTLAHWKLSLEQLFKSRSKHPKYMELTERKKTFPEVFGHSSSFAQSGFFYSAKIEENDILCCYDCGLEIYQCHWDMMRDYVLNDVNIMHAANLLRYKAQYNLFLFEAHLKQKTGRKEILFDLYAKSFSVNPECKALKSFDVNFHDVADRRKSFNGD